MGAPAFFSGERARDDGFRDLDERTQFQRLDQIGVEDLPLVLRQEKGSRNRVFLIAQGRDSLCSQITDITGLKTVGLFTDIDAQLGEQMIVFTLDQDLEAILEGRPPITSRASPGAAQPAGEK
jgi:hypothetical protein